MRKGFAIISLMILSVSIAGAEKLESRKARAVSVADEIINMRSYLAGSFITPGAEITEETFKNTCGAVGKRVKEIMEAEGFKIRHAALKNRNPNFAANPGEAKILEEFDKDRNLKEKWDKVEIEGKQYQRYMRPIFVEESCLACHGAKGKRPKFIVEKYLDDKAFDFRAGDLRGMIEVLVKE